MKKLLLVLFALPGFYTVASAQCLTISCPPSVSTSNDPGMCGATVTYTSPVVNSTCTGTLTDTFFYTGSQQTYVVPSGVTTLTIETWGAQGGANWVNNNNFGGYVKADIAVTPGETLYVYVGQQPNGITGGYNGGGNGEGAGQGGGGGSDVRQGGTTLNDRVVVAGGGGGAGYWSSLHVVGGVGGGMTGANGYRDPDYASNPGGQGASQTAGGPDGTCVSYYNTICAGGFGYGGAPSSCGCEGYGGGGGWYGGAGSGNCRGGGGGSGYAIPAATNVTMSSGVRVGNGMVVIGFSGTTPPVLTQTSGLASGSLFPVGTTTNTFEASDAFGNSQTCSFTVTVADTEAPVLAGVPANISQSNDPAQCGAAVSWTVPTASDNCAATVIGNYNSGNVFPLGTTTVVYVATDPSGNADTASFTVTINDTEPPALTCPVNVTVNADSGQCSASAVVLGNATATDNCSSVSVSNDAPSVFPIGTTMVTWTATDSSGNSSTCSQMVMVNDTQAPVFNSCPADTTICAGVFTFNAPMATDNCAFSLSQTAGPQSGDTLAAGNYTITYAATDSAGNASACTFVVTVNPAPAVTLDLGALGFACIDDGASALNGGNPAGGTWSGTGVTGSTFNPSAAGAGQHAISYTYTDNNGCTVTAVDTIVVDMCVGISENGGKTFYMYPNPASGSFWFITPAAGTMELLDVSGKLVKARHVVSGKEQIELSDCAPGVYMVRFTTESGNVSTAQLIIQR